MGHPVPEVPVMKAGFSLDTPFALPVGFTITTWREAWWHPGRSWLWTQANIGPASQLLFHRPVADSVTQFSTWYKGFLVTACSP